MKSLKYAISSLQKECSDAFVPDCGALTCFKGARSAKPIHKITQTVEDVDSQSNTAFKDGISSGTFFSASEAAHNDSS